jgi:hypothetical protein
VIWLGVSAAVALGVLAWALLRDSAPPVWLTGLTVLIPVLAAMTLYGTRDNLGNVRVALEAVQFEAGEAGTVAAIGSDPAKSEIVVKGLAPVQAKLVRDASGQLNLTPVPGEGALFVDGKEISTGQAALFCLHGTGCLRSAAIAVRGAPDPKSKKLPKTITLGTLSLDGVFDPEADTPAPLTVRLVFARPDVLLLDAEDMRAEAQKRGNGPFKVALAAAGSDERQEAQAPPQLSLGRLGGRFRDQLDYTIAFENGQIKVEGLSPIWILKSGEAVAPGGNAKAVIRIIRQDRDWADLNVVFWILLIGGVGTVASTWSLRRRGTAGLVLFLLLDFLLSARVLVAFEAAYIDSSDRTDHIVSGALIAASFCPLLLAFVTARGEALLARTGQTLMAIAIMAAVELQFRGAGIWTWLGLAGYGAAVIALGREWFSRLVHSAPPQSVAKDEPPRDPKPWVVDLKQVWRWTVAVWRKADGWFRRVTGLPLWWVAAWAGLIAFRLLLLFDKHKEGVGFGNARIGIAAIYAPAALVLFAVFFAARQTFRPLAWHRFSWLPTQEIVFFLALISVYFAAPYAAEDNGEMIYALPAIAMAAAFRSAARERTQIQRIIDIVLCVTIAAAGALVLDMVLRSVPWAWCVAGVFVVIAGIVVLARPAAGMAVPAAMLVATLSVVVITANGSGAAAQLEHVIKHPNSESTREFLDKAASTKMAKVRMLQFFHPEMVASFGTREAENLRVTMAHLKNYSGYDTGVGYMQVRAPTILKRYHVDDNVSAVHLLAPFGRVGTMLFLLLEVAAAAAVTLCAARLAEPGRRGPVAAVLAVWTITLVSLYMVLANMGCVPFTGRNVYLISVASGSDVVEAMALIVIARLGLKAIP